MEDINKDIRDSKKFVIPGDLVDTGKLRSGIGTYKMDGKIFAAQLGFRNIRADYVNVIPLAGKYMPKVNDMVIGKIVNIGPAKWLVDINSPYPAPLHINEVPWKVEFGDTARYLKIGDTVLVNVLSVDEIKRVQVSLKGVGLRRLTGGHIVEIIPAKVPRLIGKGGSMISLIKQHTGCRIFVGQNGRIWLDGELEDIALTIKVIRKIESEAHLSGLTNEIEKYLSNIQKEELT